VNTVRIENSVVASKKLVIGIGNEFRGDDGAGLFVARKAAEILGGGATILESNGEGTELIDMWAGYDLVINIDAVHSDSEPGKIFRFDLPGDTIPRALFPGHSTHAFGLLEAIELGGALGRLPSKAIVYGIEGKSFETGEGLSPEVMKAAEQLLARLPDDIEQFGWYKV
jgi:hydrogenase maturation protease